MQTTGTSKINGVAIFFLEVVKIAVIALLTIWLVRYFLFKPFLVEGASMEPNFKQNDYLIIDELKYRLSIPERGEVVVFKFPLNPKVNYIKRIIGLPGERVKIEQNTVIIYNKDNAQGMVLAENFIGEEKTSGTVDVTLGEDEYFVMGDNRENSYDSRRFGPIQKDSIVGRAVLRGWPLNRVGLIKSQE